jgi:hypothetical protein
VRLERVWSMQEYLYVLSNPAMPGLIKIGKTTTSPNQRMSELFSTGVPSPFVLELSLQVEDCHVSERAAHQALIDCRLANNREFFKASIAHAIKTILPAIGQYRIHTVRTAHGITEIEQELLQKRHAAEKLRAEKEASARQRKLEDKRRFDTRRVEIEHSIKVIEQKIRQLGERPVRRELSGIDSVFLWAYCPLPLGWIVWLNTAQIFSPGREVIGMVCIVVLIIGFACSSAVENDRKAFKDYEAPFLVLDRKREELISELQAVKQSIYDMPVAPSPPTKSLAQHGVSDRFSIEKSVPPKSTETNAIASDESKRKFKKESSVTVVKSSSSNGLDLPFGFKSIDELTQLAIQDKLTKDQLITIRNEAPYLGLRWKDLEVVKEALNRK